MREHGGLRSAGGARGVPEARDVPFRRGSRERAGGRRRQEPLDGRVTATDVEHGLHTAGHAGRAEAVGIREHQPHPRVVEHERDFRRREASIDADPHRARPQNAQLRDDVRNRVRQIRRDAITARDPAIRQDAGEPIDAVVERPEGHALGAIDQRLARGPSPCGTAERFGRVHRAVMCSERSLGSSS